MSEDQKAVLWLTKDEIDTIAGKKPVTINTPWQWETHFPDNTRVLLKLYLVDYELRVKFEWYDKLGSVFYTDDECGSSIKGEYWPAGTEYADHFLYILEEGEDPDEWADDLPSPVISQADKEYLRSYGFSPINTGCTAWRQMIGKCQVTITWDDEPKWWLAETFQPDVFPAFYASTSIHDALYGLLYRFRQHVIKDIYERQASLKAVESLLIDLGNDTIDKSCMEKQNVPEESDRR